jgi:hypothetical protein
MVGIEGFNNNIFHLGREDKGLFFPFLNSQDQLPHAVTLADIPLLCRNILYTFLLQLVAKKRIVSEGFLDKFCFHRQPQLVETMSFLLATRRRSTPQAGELPSWGMGLPAWQLAGETNSVGPGSGRSRRQNGSVK